ncbi:hypothetical protein DHD32_22630 [Arenibacter sp. TNZ]|uniref:hypothetical protein n=1 Tax=Arenibacter TaxID=178469 RepID=UPI000CD4015D|nr:MULTISPECIES: hypothetical protein [Arenibacter]MCM4174266.1 hypothetical protein [Arenibacter sp. TNZ]
MKENYDFLMEWAVWGHLDSRTDLELILLKGHLLIEKILDGKLNRCGIENRKSLSFYSKILAIEKLDFEQTEKKKIIVNALKKLNKLRNNLAHDYKFDLNNGELELWVKGILKNLNGEKYTRFTFRTKIVHAFSTLTISVLELTNKEKQYEYNNL